MKLTSEFSPVHRLHYCSLSQPFAALFAAVAVEIEQQIAAVIVAGFVAVAVVVEQQKTEY